MEYENALRLREKALAFTSCGVTVADARRSDMPIIYVNQAFVDITGYTREDILGRNCRVLQGEKKNQTGVEEIRRALIEGRHCKVVLHNFRKDGMPFWNELALSPILDRGGRISYFVGIQTDVTRREEARHDLSRVVADLAQTHQDADRFIQLVAREMQRPLRAVEELGRDLIETLEPEHATRHRLVTDLRDRASDLQQQIDGWLERARGHAVRLPHEDVDLGILLGEIRQDLTPSTAVDLRLPQKLPSVRADRPSLEHIFRSALRCAELTGGLRLRWHSEMDSLWRFSLHHPRPVAQELPVQILWQELRATLYRLRGHMWQEDDPAGEIWYLEWPRHGVDMVSTP